MGAAPVSFVVKAPRVVYSGALFSVARSTRGPYEASSATSCRMSSAVELSTSTLTTPTSGQYTVVMLAEPSPGYFHLHSHGAHLDLPSPSLPRGAFAKWRCEDHATVRKANLGRRDIEHADATRNSYLSAVRAGPGYLLDEDALLARAFVECTIGVHRRVTEWQVALDTDGLGWRLSSRRHTPCLCGTPRREDGQQQQRWGLCGSS